MEEEIEGKNRRRNILSIILIAVAIGAFLYFTLSPKPTVYSSLSNLSVTTKPAGIPFTKDNNNLDDVTINSITSNSAILNGSYMNGQSASTWFEYGVDKNFLINLNKTNQVHQFNKSNDFSENVSGLGPNIEIFYRAVGQNAGGPIVYGKILSFKTKPDTTGQAPIVQTNTENNDWQCEIRVGKNNICLTGEFIANGLPTKAWFEYGTTKSLGKSTKPKDVGNDSGDFNDQAYFKPEVGYYVRMVAKNSAGTTRGNILTYTSFATK